MSTTDPVYSYARGLLGAHVIVGAVNRGQQYPHSTESALFVADQARQQILVLRLTDGGRYAADKAVLLDVQPGEPSKLHVVTVPAGCRSHRQIQARARWIDVLPHLEWDRTPRLCRHSTRASFHTDAEQVATLKKLMFVGAGVNSAPTIESFVVSPTEGNLPVSLQCIVAASDADNDSLTVRITLLILSV